MFGSARTPFGSNTGFGLSSGNQQNPFASTRQVFSASSTFGTSAPASGQTSTNMFGSQPTPPFGSASTPTQNEFGSSGLFGQPAQNAPSTSFRQTTKTNGFSLPSIEQNMFGQASQPQANVFQSLFSTSGFGSQPAQSGTVIKFAPVIGTDSMQKGGHTTTINTKNHSITCMKGYESKSFEELRFEDYSVNRKGPQQSTGFGESAQPFGAATQFGQTKNNPAFGSTNGFGQTSTFGVPNQTSTSQCIFAKTATPFGSTVTTPSTFGCPSSTTNIFGSMPAKSFSTQPSQSPFPNTSHRPSGFGHPTNQQPSIPMQTGLYSFRQPGTLTQSSLFQPPKSSAGFGGIFSNNQPTTSTAFAQSAASGFTGFNSTFAKPASNMFGQQIGFGGNTLMNQNSSNNILGGMGAKPNFGTGNTSGGLFSAPCIQMNNQPSLQMQPVSQPMVLRAQSQTAEIQGLLNLSDPYGLSPHLGGLAACKSDSTYYVTNPKELDDVIKKDDLGPISSQDTKKVKLNVSNIEMNKLFDEAYANDDAVTKMFGIRRNLKQLIIKTPVEKPKPIVVYQHGKLVDNSGNSGNRVIASAFKSPSGNASKGDTKGNATQYNNDAAPIKTPASVSESNAFDKTAPIEKEPITSGKAVEEKPHTSTSTTSLQMEPVTSTDNIDTCGIVCTRPEYYTIPPLDEIANYKNPDGTCYIKGFTIGRVGYGNVHFPEAMDVSNLNIDELVHFRFREIIIYPDDNVKPPVGEGLNRRAQVTLDTVYPRKKDNENQFEKDPEEILKRHYTETLKFVCERAKTTFVDYKPEVGSWVFNVVHFSKYNLTASEEKQCEEKCEQQTQQPPMPPQQQPQPQPQPKQRSPSKSEIPLAKREGEMDIVFHEHMKIYPLDQGDLCREMGITSITYPLVDLDISTSNSYNLDQSDSNIFLMRSLFYDNEPENPKTLDVDVGDEDVISISNRIVNIETNYNDRVIRKRYEVVRDIFTISNKLYRAPAQHSLVPAKCVLDAAVMKGKSYKVGWGKGFTLATIFSKAVDGISHVSSTLESYVYTPTKILLVDVSQCRLQKTETDPFKNELPRFMDIILHNSTCVMETVKRLKEQIPRWEINIGHQLTEDMCDYWETYNDKHKDDMRLKYYKNVWDLCLAFWGEIEGPHSAEVIRKEHFNDWLENVTEELMHTQFNKLGSSDTINKMMVYLSGHKIKEAVKLAATNKMPQLSLLLSQLNSNKNTRYCTGFQVKSWEVSGAIDFIEGSHLKLYIICCGVLYYGILNACEGFDWLRALGMHLWYQLDSTSPLKCCFEVFENAFYGINSYAEKPFPLYGVNESSWDIMYYLMKLYCNDQLDLDVVLSPATHTNDCTDYRLSWLLMQTLHSLQVGVLNKNAVNKIITLYATQLEQLGYFKWAVFVLLFLIDTQLRMNLVFGVLDRNLIDSDSDRKVEIELVRKLNVPPEWIHMVKSLKSKQLKKYWHAYRHLGHAHMWNEYHELFFKEMLPTLVANQQIPLLRDLLTEMENGQGEIIRWKSCGGFLLDFITLWLEIEENMHCADAYQYKQMYSSINTFSWKINRYPIMDQSQNMIISIISQKTAELFNNLLVMLQIEKKPYIEMTSNWMQRLIMPNDLKYEKFSNLLLSFKKL